MFAQPLDKVSVQSLRIFDVRSTIIYLIQHQTYYTLPDEAKRISCKVQPMRLLSDRKRGPLVTPHKDSEIITYHISSILRNHKF